MRLPEASSATLRPDGAEGGAVSTRLLGLTTLLLLQPASRRSNAGRTTRETFSSFFTTGPPRGDWRYCGAGSRSQGEPRERHGGCAVSNAGANRQWIAESREAETPCALAAAAAHAMTPGRSWIRCALHEAAHELLRVAHRHCGIALAL